MIKFNLKPYTCDNIWFILVLSLLVMHYARPQEIITPLAHIKPFFILSLVTWMFLIVYRISGDMLSLKIPQIRYMWYTVIWGVCMFPLATYKSMMLYTLQLMILNFMPFILSVAAIIKERVRLDALLNTLIYITLFLAIRGIFSTHAGYFKGANWYLGNFMNDPNDVAMFMNMMFPLCVFKCISEVNRIRKLIFLTAALFAFTVIIMTLSRGGFLALLCTCGIMFYISPYKKYFLIISVILGFATVIFAGSTWKDTASSSFDTGESTAQHRLVLWGASTKLFITHPWGVGFEGNRRSLHEYGSGDRLWGLVNHSTWLTALSEGGIVGFLLYLMIIRENYRILNIGRKSTNSYVRNTSLALLCSLSAYLISSTFITSNYSPHFWYLSVFIAMFGRLSIYQENTVKDYGAVYKFSRMVK